ncbi:hypothetical protein K431DRAFT_308079 [Polychaeton citri CBS 116435]|uniref:Uncharacterized protein n=1 Tax=Polychaeton citri CBS 116435 TaxID=1314669 RepID=A0A9P4UK95_9PEZI|nr:hypothetical protein K431DRAFT_308079 [Polychaeton citri CBS 116435]
MYVHYLEASRKLGAVIYALDATAAATALTLVLASYKPGLKGLEQVLPSAVLLIEAKRLLLRVSKGVILAVLTRKVSCLDDPTVALVTTSDAPYYVADARV